MRLVSIITARGNSKGLPQKNIRSLSGRPLIDYSIQASIGSEVAETYVTSDSDRILEIARSAGAKCIKRPEELSDDVIMPDAAVIHALKRIECTHCIFIQPTSPMITSDIINDSILFFNNSDFDSIFTCHKKLWKPIWTINNGEAIPFGWNPAKRPRRQDVEPKFEENGMLYISSKEMAIKSGLRYSGKIGGFEISEIQGSQIDTIDDFALMEKIL